MNIITSLNEKGGCGKTTLSVTLAAGLASRGYRVVLIDTDAQANATMALGMSELPHVYNFLVREDPLNEVIRRVPADRYATNGQSQGELLLIASNVESRNIASSMADVAIFRQRLEEMDGWADFVIIDTSPTPSLLHSAIYLATDAALYPTTCEPLSVTGLERSIGRLVSAEKLRSGMALPPITALGIVPTMVRPTSLHNLKLSELKEQHGDLVWDALPQRITWGEASHVGRSVFAYEGNSVAATEAWKVVSHVETTATPA